MRGAFPNLRRSLKPVLIAVARLMLITVAVAGALLAGEGAGAGQTPEQRASDAMESVRTHRPELWAFLAAMPKGADLHNHISGAVYAESYIRWAAEASTPRLCIDLKSMGLSRENDVNPCSDLTRPPASRALSDSGLYNRLIDAWSMRNWTLSGQSGHDHFFDTFGKFGQAGDGRVADMLAEVVSRAAKGKVDYMELMITPDNGVSNMLGAALKWNGDFAEMRRELLDKGISRSVQTGRSTLDQAQQGERKILACGTAKADPGCSVTVKFIFQIARMNPAPVAFAQMVAAMELASQDADVVALNLVQPEDALPALKNFDEQMRMLAYLHSVYPKVHITLHAGELAPGLVEPDALESHIRDSIEMGHAERIGHGVDVMQERDPIGLLKKMAGKKILVEICLTSNDVILGVRGKDHPLHAYIKYGVPVALATDDEGVSRSEITAEYVRAVEEQGLAYLQLKQMARNSLEYSFAGGGSLWANMESARPVPQCAIKPGAGKASAQEHRPSPRCEEYLAANEKARLQWRLEQDFRQFESSIARKAVSASSAPRAASKNKPH